MNYQVTRRSFLAASLAVIPGAWSLGWLSKLSLKEAEFEIRLEDWPSVLVTTYTNGKIEASWGGRTLDVELEEPGFIGLPKEVLDLPEVFRKVERPSRWYVASGEWGYFPCRLRFRLPSPRTLDLAWIMIYRWRSLGDNAMVSKWETPKMDRSMQYDNPSLWRALADDCVAGRRSP